MFESICFTPRASVFAGADLGALAEALIYYRRVHIMLNRSSLNALLSTLGVDTVLRLAEAENVQLHYVNAFHAVYSEGPPERRIHRYGSFETPDTRLDEQSDVAFIEVIGNQGKGRRTSRKFKRFVNEKALDPRIPEQALSDATSTDLIRQTATLLLGQFETERHELTKELFFEVLPEGDDAFTIETNLDFEHANQLFGNGAAVITESLIASYSAVDLTSLSLAADLSAELDLDPLESDVAKLRNELIFSARGETLEQTRKFESYVVPNAPSIAEAVNSGVIEFSEVLGVAEKAIDFRDWLRDVDPSTELLAAYIGECTQSEMWMGLPQKSLSWLLTTGATTAAGSALPGTSGIIAGTVLGLGAFFREQLQAGWKPNHFVNRHLVPLVGDSR